MLFDAKEYFDLRVKLLQYEGAHRLTRLFALIIALLAAFFFGTIALLMGAIAVVFALMPSLGAVWASVIVGGGFLILALLLFICRKTLFIAPLSRIIGRILIDKPNEMMNKK